MASIDERIAALEAKLKQEKARKAQILPANVPHKRS